MKKSDERRARLNELVGLMRTLAQAGSDPEAEHDAADLLLQDAVVLLAEAAGNGAPAVVKELLAYYEEVKKLYA